MIAPSPNSFVLGLYSPIAWLCCQVMHVIHTPSVGKRGFAQTSTIIFHDLKKGPSTENSIFYDWFSTVKMAKYARFYFNFSSFF